jgi:hypothetical protein
MASHLPFCNSVLYVIGLSDIIVKDKERSICSLSYDVPTVAAFSRRDTIFLSNGVYEFI